MLWEQHARDPGFESQLGPFCLYHSTAAPSLNLNSLLPIGIANTLKLAFILYPSQRRLMGCVVSKNISILCMLFHMGSPHIKSLTLSRTVLGAAWKYRILCRLNTPTTPSVIGTSNLITPPNLLVDLSRAPSSASLCSQASSTPSVKRCPTSSSRSSFGMVRSLSVRFSRC